MSQHETLVTYNREQLVSHKNSIQLPVERPIYVAIERESGGRDLTSYERMVIDSSSLATQKRMTILRRPVSERIMSRNVSI